MGTGQDDRADVYGSAETLEIEQNLWHWPLARLHRLAVMTSPPPTPAHAITTILALSAALFTRSWLQVELRASDMDKLYAADLSYLVVPPILLLLLLPVLRANRAGLRRQLDIANIRVGLVLSAIGLGALLRLAWWCQLAAGISIGVYSNGGPYTTGGPVFNFQCPPAYVIATGVIVMAMLVPVIEEIVHRGLVQSALYRYGPTVAILGGAAVFTVFHPPGSWGFVFSAGVMLGMQYRMTKSLWSSLISHATINALIQLDWRCLRGQWNPPATEIPLFESFAVALLLFFVCIGSIVAILVRMHRGDMSPRCP